MITTIAKATDGFPDDQNRDLNYNYLHLRGHDTSSSISHNTKANDINSCIK